MTAPTAISQRLPYLRRAGHQFKVSTIYGLMAIAIIYGALALIAIAIIGAIATPVFSIISLVLGPIGDTLSPRP